MLCSKCKQKIVGQYLTALGKKWHIKCFCCSHCKKPLVQKGFLTKNGRPYCQKDYEKLFLDPCSICKKPLKGEYHLDGWQNKYCASHYKRLAPCISCQRLICQALTQGGVNYSGYAVCQLCHRTAVCDVAKASEIYQRVARRLARWGLAISQKSIPLRLVGLAEMQRFSSKKYQEKPTGLILTEKSTANDRCVSRRVKEILLLKGLSQEHCAAVIAHELGHAYLFLKGFPLLSPKIEEGFAELSAYLWLKGEETPFGHYQRNNMKKNTHPVYGKGFQEAYWAWRKNSLPRVLMALKREKSFPR